MEERHRKRRLKRKQHSRAQCWCVATTTHTWGRQDKTWEWVDTQGEERRGTHKGKWKGEDKAWLSQRHSPHRKREKGKKTMSILRQSRALHRVHLLQPIIGTCMPGMTRKGRDRRGRRKREEREKERKEEKKGDRKGRKKGKEERQQRQKR